MDLREDTLDPAHRKTFNWFIDLSGSSREGPSSPFLRWLSTEEPMFWLSGKAGSGKSTLMKFLITHPDLDAVLHTTIPGKRILVAWHYLFERGKDPLQKSLEGLLRHLLYHLVSQNKLFAKPIFRQQKVTRTFNYQKKWSWKELNMALQAVLTEKPPEFEVILLIDGLDEYRPVEKLLATENGQYDDDDDDDDDEDPSSDQARMIADGHHEIADLVCKLSQFENVRLCVSSRPLLVFRDTFASFPSVELHSLTTNDIRSYVTDRLNGNQSLMELNVLRPSFALDVEKEILAKADGVFLWVRLVLDVLIRGLSDRDTVDELLHKLRSMPKQLGGKKGLYMAMLLNLPVAYRKQSYEYFQILQHAEEDLDPLVLSFAIEDPQIVFTTPIGHSVPQSETDIRRKRTMDRLLSRCGGLLEKTTNSDRKNPLPRVDFIHQTAKEFVKKRRNWEYLLQTSDIANFDGSLALLRASVMMLKCSKARNLLRSSNDRWYKLHVCLQYARAADLMSAAQTAELLLLIDKTMFSFKQADTYFHTTHPQQGRYSGVPNFDDMLSNYHTITQGRTMRQKTEYMSEHWAVNDPFETDTFSDKNFIAVAVQNNLGNFLRLASKNGKIVQKLFQTKYPLLAYALVPCSFKNQFFDFELKRYQSLPNVTHVLLELGLNPNEKYTIPSLPVWTVWEGFLTIGYYNLGELPLLPMDYHEKDDKEIFRIWLGNARFLVQHGADVNATVDSWKAPLLLSSRQYRRLSALFCVILCLWHTYKHQSWHEGLLEMMVEKGFSLLQGELNDLLELAGMFNVQQPFVQGVLEALAAKAIENPQRAVRGGALPQDTVPAGLVQTLGLLSVENHLAPLTSTQNSSGIQSTRADSVINEWTGPGVETEELARRRGLKRVGKGFKRLIGR
ncbi:uncharacterized protein SPSK_05936 [Sporothrix schenckii 1099-18]|uniref:Uncharacterized protein n=1 Tax=Sporothrix schenckii 1099-18 TaxID=1397361 RepID=A0A0F2ML84_SPOSC|nr:uncharacterized protein SPSK_05936 [Sporothrix schenckii 1099-18]KJR89829.1 hypothetical protein SPSK_05936 [Sporothrix schenckii 1099-18]